MEKYKIKGEEDDESSVYILLQIVPKEAERRIPEDGRIRFAEMNEGLELCNLACLHGFFSSSHFFFFFLVRSRRLCVSSFSCGGTFDSQRRREGSRKILQLLLLLLKSSSFFWACARERKRQRLRLLARSLAFTHTRCFVRTKKEDRMLNNRHKVSWFGSVRFKFQKILNGSA